MVMLEYTAYITDTGPNMREWDQWCMRAYRWERAPARGQSPAQRARQAWARLRAGWRDVECWTLGMSTTLRLLLALVVLVAFGAALFA